MAEVAPAFDALKGRVDAMYVCAETLGTRPAFASIRWRSGAISDDAQFVKVGGLMSFGTNFPPCIAAALN